MNRLLLVDTAPENLAAYQAIFANEKERWDCFFAGDTKNAFDQLSLNDFDIVLADAKTPATNGVPFLETVSQMYPDIIRVALVPSLTADYPKNLVKSAHKIIEHSSSEKLEEQILRGFRLYKTIMSPKVTKFVDGLETIPSLPKVYSDLLAELEKESPSVRKAGEIIAQDLGMSASILKMVNSSYFGLSKQITSPEFAVSLLGLDIVRGLVLTAHLFTAFSNAETRLLGLEAMVEHSLLVGFLAREIAKHEGLPSETIDAVNIAGILHDVGRLIFASHSPKLYKNVIDTAAKENRPIREIELELFGATHAEVGAFLLAQWGLSETVIELIAYHNSGDTPDYLSIELGALKVAGAYSDKKPEDDFSAVWETIFADSPLLSDKKEKWDLICKEIIKNNNKECE